MKKLMGGIEVVASISLFVSKYFLATSNELGWAIAVVGYFLVTIYNFNKELRILAVVSIGLLGLSLYGWYKWSSELSGLQLIDYVVISCTIIAGIGLAYHEWKTKKPMWLSQVLATTLCMIAYVFIGLHYDAGWGALLIAHIFLGSIYFKNKGYMFAILQVFSFYIALAMITPLPLPF